MFARLHEILAEPQRLVVANVGWETIMTLLKRCAGYWRRAGNAARNSLHAFPVLFAALPRGVVRAFATLVLLFAVLSGVSAPVSAFEAKNLNATHAGPAGNCLRAFLSTRKTAYVDAGPAGRGYIGAGGSFWLLNKKTTVKSFTETNLKTLCGYFNLDLLKNQGAQTNSFTDEGFMGLIWRAHETENGQKYYYRFGINGNINTSILDTREDIQKPGVTINGAPSQITTRTPFTVTYTFDEDVWGFDDLTAVNAATQNATATNLVTITPNRVFTATITPDGAGDVVLGVRAGAAQDKTPNRGLPGTSDNPSNAAANVTVRRAPMIAVNPFGKNSIANGGTDQQGTQPAGKAMTVFYNITNTGLADLTFQEVTTTGALDNVKVEITNPPPPRRRVAPNETATFAVSYTPDYAGAFSFNLRIPNNSTHARPFDFTVRGTATGDPVIKVTSSEDGVLTDNGTDDQGVNVAAGQARTVTYTVTNTGFANLTFKKVTTTGALTNVGNVTIKNSHLTNGSLQKRLARNQTATFEVTYTPTVAGDFSFGLSFENNDAGRNPFNFTVSGTATGKPMIEVRLSENGRLIQNSQRDQRRKVPLGQARAATYKIRNTGLANLRLQDVTEISKSRKNIKVLTITGPDPKKLLLEPGQETEFTVTYTPKAAGVFSFGLNLRNNSANANPFNFTVGSTAITPEIKLSSPTNSHIYYDGRDDQKTAVAADQARNVTYTVKNIGTADLTLQDVIKIGAADNVAVGTITSLRGKRLVPNATTTFTVTYTPKFAGKFSFKLSFKNNTHDEDPFDFTIRGTATGKPGIVVAWKKTGANIADNGAHAQGRKPAGTAETVTYRVRNTGLANLRLQDVTVIPGTKDNIKAITITNPDPKKLPLAPGQETTFTVSYTPTVAGAFSFGLTFNNNDLKKNPFNFTVSGTATGDPEIVVALKKTGATIADGGAHAQGRKPAGAAETVTYRVRNTGLANLTLQEVTVIPGTKDNIKALTITGPKKKKLAPGEETEFEVSYTPTAAGAFSFGLTFDNNDANKKPFNFTVRGVGSANPVITVPDDITVDAEDDKPTARVEFTGKHAATATDHDGVKPLIYNPPSGHDFPIGPNGVTVTATDNAGDSSQAFFKVTVIDKQKPKITVPSDITRSTGKDERTVKVTWAAPTATDNSRKTTTPKWVSSSPTPNLTSGSDFPIGVTEVTYSATDSSGNKAEKSFTVTINDKQKPKITVPDDITVDAEDGKPRAKVTFTGKRAATATDNSGNDLTLTYSPASGHNFPVGSTKVTVTATDKAGNKATATFKVIVKDRQKPKFTFFPDDIAIKVDYPKKAAVATWKEPTAADNVDETVTPEWVSSAPAKNLKNGDEFPLGTTTVTYEARDKAKNAIERSVNVSVSQIPPGSVTFIVKSAKDGAFTFKSPEPALNITINAKGGSGKSDKVLIRPGSYDVSFAAADNSNIAAAQCSPDSSKLDAETKKGTIVLVSGVAVTCTIDALDSRGITSGQIGSFMQARSELILANQPDLERRLDRLNGRTGGATGVSGFGLSLSPSRPAVQRPAGTQ